MSVGTVSLTYLASVALLARWLGWSPGAPGRGGQEVAITMKPSRPRLVPVCSRDASRAGGGWGGSQLRAGGRRSSSSSVNKGSGLLRAALPDASGGRFPPAEPRARSSCSINGEWTKWIQRQLVGLFSL